MSYKVPGPLKIEFGPSGGLVDLGYSTEGVIINLRTLWVPRSHQHSGNTPATAIFAGKNAQVSVVTFDTDQIKLAFAVAYDHQENKDDIFSLGYYPDTGYSPAIGTLLSTRAKTLKLTQRDDGIWQASKAFPLEPRQLTLQSTLEHQFPITFILLPDDDKKLFQTTPSFT